LAVNAADMATPAAFVVAVVTPPAKLPPAPVAGAPNATVIPLTGFPAESITVADRGDPKAVLIVVVCGVPPVAATEAAGPAVLVNKKLAGAATPETDAVTVYDPAVEFALNIAAVATPDPFVTAVVLPLAKLPLGPVRGAAKVTVTPLIGLLPASFTVAASCIPNPVLMTAA